jgi:hypothetical protein
MENNKQQTGVDFIIENLIKYPPPQSKEEFLNGDWKEIIVQAKKMDEERMIKFACDVFDTNYGKDASFQDTAKQVYKKTYGGDK